jgi:tRNA-Thr(GGU) m(6)t(6)A37 methyltransferase TsaA
MEATLATQDARSCAVALRAAAETYRTLRDAEDRGSLARRDAAERAAMAYLEEIVGRLSPPAPVPDVQPIGTVRNNVTDAGDEQWGSVVSEILLRPELRGGLRGIEQFSHAVVVFLMHHSRFDPGAPVVRRPRDRADMPETGIFSQRAKHRPNPIGVTTVGIERLADGVLVVRGLDAIDGTPVLDVKPHVPVFDAPAGARVPPWVDRLMAGYF